MNNGQMNNGMKASTPTGARHWAQRGLRGVLAATVGALVAASVAGCASIPEPKPDECQVRTDYMMGGKYATVKHGEARLTQLFGERIIASSNDDNVFRYHIPAGFLAKGRLDEEGRLMMEGVLDISSDPISGGTFDVHWPLYKKTFTYSAACTPRDAALGAWAIILKEYEESI